MGELLSPARLFFTLGQGPLGFLGSARMLVGSGTLTFEHFTGSLSFRELRFSGLLMPLCIGTARARLHAPLTYSLGLALTERQRRGNDQQHEEDDDQCDDPCIHASFLPDSFVGEAAG